MMLLVIEREGKGTRNEAQDEQEPNHAKLNKISNSREITYYMHRLVK
jgi:hypothetical protein